MTAIQPHALRSDYGLALDVMRTCAEQAVTPSDRGRALAVEAELMIRLGASPQRITERLMEAETILEQHREHLHLALLVWGGYYSSRRERTGLRRVLTRYEQLLTEHSDGRYAWGRMLTFRAKLHRSSGEYSTAVEDLTRALPLESDPISRHLIALALAWTFVRLHRPGAAAQALNDFRISELTPGAMVCTRAVEAELAVAGGDLVAAGRLLEMDRVAGEPAILLDLAAAKVSFACGLPERSRIILESATVEARRFHQEWALPVIRRYQAELGLAKGA